MLCAAGTGPLRLCGRGTEWYVAFELLILFFHSITLGFSSVEEAAGSFMKSTFTPILSMSLVDIGHCAVNLNLGPCKRRSQRYLHRFRHRNAEELELCGQTPLTASNDSKLASNASDSFYNSKTGPAKTEASATQTRNSVITSATQSGCGEASGSSMTTTTKGNGADRAACSSFCWWCFGCRGFGLL